MMIILLKGLALGFSIAAPVGPIGVLCIRRTLAHGRLYGFLSGLGAATADALYGGVAGFGLTFIADFLITQDLWLRIGGGFFLCYLGVKTFRAIPAKEEVKRGAQGYLSAYSSTLILTLTNPMTIISFAAIFAGLGVVGNSSYLAASTLVLGVFLGSALWWFILSSTAYWLRKKLDTSGLQLVNQISGSIIFLFGLMALTNLF